MARTQHPVRRCAPCDTDWPNNSTYNLCPGCLRNTYASTADEIPNFKDAQLEAERFQRIRDFDAECDAKADAARAQWVAEWNALLELTPSIPDPDEAGHA